MFRFFKKSRKDQQPSKPVQDVSRQWSGHGFGVESLETRRLLSSTWDMGSCTPTDTTGSGTTTTTTPAAQTAMPAMAMVRMPTLAAADTTATTTAPTTSKINFSDAPAAVQTGLKALAQGVTIAAATSVRVVTLSDGTSTYSASIAVKGKRSHIAVDGSGNALEGKIQFSAAPTVVQTGLQAQLSSATISDSQIVTIHTRHGTTVYSTSVNTGGKAKTVAVDATGTAVTRKGRTLDSGNTILFSAASTDVQKGLQSLAQGVTIGSDQVIDVLTLWNSTTIYSTVLSIDGEATRISVAADGTALNGDVAFSDAPAAVQTGLQTQDTGGTIPDSQLVHIRTRPGGAAVYSTVVELSAVATTIAVDSTGAKITLIDAGGDEDFGGGFDGGVNRSTVDFSAAPSAVQIGLQKIAEGATLADTQQIEVVTLSSGSMAYSTTITVDGRFVRISVDATGNPLQAEFAFSDTPTAVQTGLQTLDTAGTIPATQVVQLRTFFDGTQVYSTGVTISGKPEVIAVDASGNQVDIGRHGGVGFGGPGGFDFGGRHHGFGDRFGVSGWAASIDAFRGGSLGTVLSAATVV